MSLTTDDQVEIWALYNRYSHAIDSGDGPGFAACFTADGHLDTGMGAQVGSVHVRQAAATAAGGCANRVYYIGFCHDDVLSQFRNVLPAPRGALSARINCSTRCL